MNCTLWRIAYETSLENAGAASLLGAFMRLPKGGGDQPIPGIYPCGHPIGRRGAVAEANAYALAVTPSGETTKLTFTFKTGSRMSGTVNESEAQGVPQYRAWIETAPARLMLQFDGLSYWDFERRDWENPVWF